MNIPHPIPYQGSKRKLAQAIVACFPNDVEKLVEPFAGSAAVTIAAAVLGKARQFHINDINIPLMKLWSMIVGRPKDISASYRELWEAQHGNERDYYNSIRAKFNNTHRPDYLLYLLARCVKASVRYNTNGDFNQSPDNRRKGMHPDTMERNIVGVSRLLKGRTDTSHLDYREVLVVPQAVERKLGKCLRLLKKHGIPVESLVLYGSYAKGTASRDSDIDVLVVSSLFDAEPRARVGELWRLTLEVDSRIEPMPVGKAQMKTDNIFPLLEIARREGYVIA
jgi:predicted nucleotidyltransferase